MSIFTFFSEEETLKQAILERQGEAAIVRLTSLADDENGSFVSNGTINEVELSSKNEDPAMPLIVKGSLNFGNAFSIEEIRVFLSDVEDKKRWDSMFQESYCTKRFSQSSFTIMQSMHNS
jgi:hypothetical protein